MTSEFEDTFTFGPVLGKGAFGTVHKVVSKADNRYYALKILELKKNSPEFAYMLKECYIMMSLIHPNIVKIIDNHESNSQDGDLARIAIQLEFCPGGDLHKYINERICRPVSVKKMKKWMSQLCRALAYIHEKTIIHRDIKPLNIFLDKWSNLKIGDFGVSKEIQYTMAKTLIGTPAFMAPEAMYGKYGIEADVYSLGCVFVCLAALREFPKNMCGQFHELPHIYGDTINSIISRCVDCESSKRPTASAIEKELNKLETESQPRSLSESRQSLFSDRSNESADYPSLERSVELMSLISTSSDTTQGTLQNTLQFQEARSVQRRSIQETRYESRICFHNVHGKNIILNASRTSAHRDAGTELDGVVFTNRPINPGEHVTLEIGDINSVSNVLLAFAFTECDPSQIKGPVPPTVHDVSEAVPCWKAVRYERLKPGYKFSFYYNEDGSIYSRCKENDAFRRENQVINTEEDVWAMFGVCYQIPSVSIIDAANLDVSASDYESNRQSDDGFELLSSVDFQDFRTLIPEYDQGLSRRTENEEEEEREDFQTLVGDPQPGPSMGAEADQTTSGLDVKKGSSSIKRSASCYSYGERNIHQDEDGDVLKPLGFRLGQGQVVRRPNRNRSTSDPNQRYSYHKDSPSLAHVSVQKRRSMFESDA